MPHKVATQGFQIVGNSIAEASIGRAVASWRHKPDANKIAAEGVFGSDYFWPGNVVSLSGQRQVSPAPAVITGERLARISPQRRIALTGVLALSLALHGAALAWLAYEKASDLGTGQETIMVELVIGSNAAAGQSDVARQEASAEINSAYVPDEKKPEDTKPEEAKLEEVTPVEIPPETKTVEIQVAEPAPEQAAAVPLPVLSAPAPDETFVVAAAPPEPPKVDAPMQPLTEKPVEKPVDVKPTETKAVEKKLVEPKPVAKKTPAKKNADKKSTQARPQMAAVASNGDGIGSSQSMASYSGLVSAQLRRHQRFPAAAQSRGESGTAVVSFTIGISGSVSGVRLAKSSGSSILDDEARSIPARAGSFPPPPSGRAAPITVPFNFNIR